MKTENRQPFPWQDVMAFGFGHLRLSPNSFWSMTPTELGAAMRAHGVGVTNKRSLSSLRKLISADAKDVERR